MATSATHEAQRMGGRDPDEPGRTATPLELLFDLTFVIAYGAAANELAHALADGHLADGVLGFVFAAMAVTWAWIQYSWFASAYDTDDWIFRLLTMVQMVGVLILALGLPAAFESLTAGDFVDNRVIVLGYVVMRVPMVAQWLRAARQDPGRSRVAYGYVSTILVAQVGWCLMLLVATTPLVMLVGVVVLWSIELSGPLYAETRLGGTPWHAHHIAERYGLLVILTLGEGMLGTFASLSAQVGPSGPGWTPDVALLGLAGVAMTFGLWWSYFVIPCGALLDAHRERSFGWGYGHMGILGAAVAVGAGLHVAAYFLEHHSELGPVGTTLTVSVPLGVFVLGLYAMYTALTRTLDPFHLVLIAISAVLLVAAPLLASAGMPLVWCLIVLALVPWVTVIGYETRGHLHNHAVLSSQSSRAGTGVRAGE